MGIRLLPAKAVPQETLPVVDSRWAGKPALACLILTAVFRNHGGGAEWKSQVALYDIRGKG
jgi:hypothetical protein